jgi:exonuclease VII small subunit
VPADPTLLKMAEDLGGIKKGVERLEKTTDSLESTVKEIETSMVRREDCLAHMAKMGEDVTAALQEATSASEEATAASEALEEVTAKTRVARTPSGQAHPAIQIAPSPRTVIAAAGGSGEMPWWDWIAARSKGILAILALLSALGACVLAVGRYAARLEEALKVVEQAKGSPKLLPPARDAAAAPYHPLPKSMPKKR